METIESIPENKSYFFLRNEFGYRIPGANFGYVLDKT
jgi:hypothetical protein